MVQRFYLSNVKIDVNVCLSPIFILDRGIYMHIIIIRVEGVHNFLIPFLNKSPPKFARSCKFIIICIEFLVQVDELFDSGGFREILVGLTYLRFLRL